MSATGPPPSRSPDPASVETAPERTAARNPWLWATAGVALLAIAFGLWGLTQAQATKEETQPPPETETASGDEGVNPGAVAAVAAAFTVARKQLNESDAQVEELEDEVDKANGEADKAQQDAACAKSMLEIVGGIPKAGSVAEGLKQAADQVTALAPKCKDSVASAGG
jgi:hypothetical protein